MVIVATLCQSMHRCIKHVHSRALPPFQHWTSHGGVVCRLSLALSVLDSRDAPRASAAMRGVHAAADQANIGPSQPRAADILKFWCANKVQHWQSEPIRQHTHDARASSLVSLHTLRPRSLRRLSETFATDAPTYFDLQRQKQWYAGGEAFDQACTRQFRRDLDSLQDGSPTGWDTPYDRLALIILADQLSRNIYRGSPQAFASDGQALRWAGELHDSGAAKQLTAPARLFSIMPYMHSEKLDEQERGIGLFQEFLDDMERLGSAPEATDMVVRSLDYAKAHRAVIQRWGRFPHRNAVLGRVSTPEEEEGMSDGSIPRFG